MLREARATIADWLARERRLALNPKPGAVEPTRHATVFLGHPVSRAGRAPSGRLRRRFRQRVSEAAERGPRALARTLSSYRGWLV